MSIYENTPEIPTVALNNEREPVAPDYPETLPAETEAPEITPINAAGSTGLIGQIKFDDVDESEIRTFEAAELDAAEATAEKVMGTSTGKQFFGAELLDMHAEEAIDLFLGRLEKAAESVSVVEIDGKRYVLGSLLTLTGKRRRGIWGLLFRMSPGFSVAGGLAEVAEIATSLANSEYLAQFLSFAYCEEGTKWTKEDADEWGEAIDGIFNTEQVVGVLYRFFLPSGGGLAGTIKSLLRKFTARIKERTN